eukprot:4838709-Alexandrium_andersonii.AAC.1
MHAQKGEAGLILTWEGNQNLSAGPTAAASAADKSRTRRQPPRCQARKRPCHSWPPKMRMAPTARRSQ